MEILLPETFYWYLLNHCFIMSYILTILHVCCFSPNYCISSNSQLVSSFCQWEYGKSELTCSGWLRNVHALLLEKWLIQECHV